MASMTRKRPVLTVTAVLLITLLLGMVLGGAIVGAIIRDRLEALGDLRTEAGFVAHVLEKVEPLSDDQKVKVGLIAGDTGKKVEALLASRRTVFVSTLDAMEADLKEVLTEEQLERWQNARLKARAYFEKKD